MLLIWIRVSLLLCRTGASGATVRGRSGARSGKWHRLTSSPGKRIQTGLDLAADVLGDRAAVGIDAPDDVGSERGKKARDRVESRLVTVAFVGRRQAAEQTDRVGMAGMR